RVTHPLQRRPCTHRRAWLIGFAILAALPMVLGAILKPTGSEDIVAFEFAGSVDRATEIVCYWQAAGHIGAAKAIMVLDIVYPFIYALAIAGACVGAAAAWSRGRMASLGIAMAWVATSAIAFDYLENVGLAISLWDTPASPWPQISAVAAVFKFTAIGLPLLYVLTWPVASRAKS
ncbi:MAG: hypothetical protein JHC95_05905, partial [Solirubrobacteraceae bacterium]|nr:hypothetical protein [Solirubrobacteraceae bacterium]